MSKSCSVVQNSFALVGRVFIVIIFVFAGFYKLMHYDAMLKMLSSMSQYSGSWLLILAIILELGGALLIFLGWFTRFGAFLLFVFVLCTMFLFHSFWTFQAAEMGNQVHHFLKNLSILGALLYLMAYGAGDFSFDWYRKHAKKTDV